MLPYLVDPGWYEAYWYNPEVARRHPRSYTAARFLLRCAFAVGAVVALTHLGPHKV